MVEEYLRSIQQDRLPITDPELSPTPGIVRSKERGEMFVDILLLLHPIMYSKSGYSSFMLC